MRTAVHSLIRAFSPILLAAPLAVGFAAPPDHWPQFRGPEATGVVDAIGLPEAWSSTDNVRWVVTIPGRGWSSPIVWGDRLFVTSAISEGAYDGKLFFLSEDGDTFVVAAGDEYRELGVNRLDEMSLATPAIADGSLFIRTMTRLYRIGTRR